MKPCARQRTGIEQLVEPSGRMRNVHSESRQRRATIPLADFLLVLEQHLRAYRVPLPRVDRIAAIEACARIEELPVNADW